MLTALADRSHKPLVAVRNGGFALVLSHPGDQSSLAGAQHSHGLLARCLCVLSEQNPTQRDHQLEFVTTDISENARSKVRPEDYQVTQSLMPLSLCPRAFPDALSSSTRAASRSAAILSTRFTVLLI